jgi:hypothetical protein
MSTLVGWGMIIRLIPLVVLLLTGINVVNAQSKTPFVSDDFEVPLLYETSEYRFRMLSVDDVDKDYDAVMSSANHLKDVWPDSGWPGELTLQQNFSDLDRHQKEFLSRIAFAYTVVSLDESQVIGCLYINPTSKRGHDAEVYFWARESELKNGLDERLYESVKGWLVAKWPFEDPAMPGREISWSDWKQLPEGSH